MYLSQYDLKRSVDKVSVTYPNFLDWQKQQTSFTHLAAARTQTFSLTGGVEPIFVNGAMISPEAFPLLKLPPYLGRVFTEQDNRLDSSRTVVLSYAFWQSRFSGESDVIGRTMLLDNQVYTVSSTNSDVARKERTTYDAVLGALYRQIAMEVSWDQIEEWGVLGLDEIALKKGHRDFVVLVTTRDVEGQLKLLGVLPDRKLETV